MRGWERLIKSSSAVGMQSLPPEPSAPPCVLPWCAVCLLQILEQDLPAGVPIVLMVTDIRTRSSSANSNSDADAAPAAAAAAAAAAGGTGGFGPGAEVLGLQLGDGWYYVNTMIDGPTADLVLRGKLQVRWEGGREQAARWVG